MASKTCVLIALYFSCVFTSFAQDNRTFEIFNIQSVLQVGYFKDAPSAISLAIMTPLNIKEVKTIKFSKYTKLNLDSLDEKINSVKKYLPVGYIRDLLGSFWRDNKPSQDSALWVIQIFVKEEKKGEYLPYLAYKITFEGTDAMKERLDPKILNVEFITEKNKLKELVERLKGLPNRN